LEKKENSSNKDEYESFINHIGVEPSPPVFFCTVEAASEVEEKRLAQALRCLEREDPSLRISLNDSENMGQTIVQGMGELHLEIIKDRLLKEYQLNIRFGPLNINYKEMPTIEVTKNYHHQKVINDKKISVEIEIKIEPKENFNFKSVNLINNESNNFDYSYLNAVKRL
jgi:elongation factor G